MKTNQHSAYVPHIDGLRAFAVLAVLLFHFKASGFGAGYLGVDVFFTISGFLVSRLIVKDIQEHGKFRFKRFFARRVKRLFPALAITCFLTAICSYIFLDAERLSAFGKSLSAAIISLSNILFWTESGYFDTGSNTKPLLHTWSLSVEEQFYLVWPLVLAISYKFSNNALRIVAPVALISSLILIAIWTLGKFDAKAPSTIFYWMPFRIFEFMLGAVAVLIYPKITKPNNLINIAGLALMFGAMFVPALTGFEYGPVLGLAACTGVALIVLTPNAIISKTVLSWRPLCWIGLISYSLYLVHWPVWIFAPEILKGDYAWIPLTLISIAITVPIYYLIETPLRHHKGKYTLHVFGFVATAIVAAGVWLNKADNLPFRSKATLTAEQIDRGKDNRFSVKTCTIANLLGPNCDLSRPNQILVFGNSHETDARNTFHQVYQNDLNVNLISFGSTNKCEIKLKEGSFFTDVTARRCKARTKALNELAFTHIVYGANLPFARNKDFYWQALDFMKARNPNLHIVVMGGFLNITEPCSTLTNKYGSFDACFKPEYTQAFQTNERELRSPSFEYLYIDRIKLMCSGNQETCISEAYGEPAFYDENHLSLGYSRLVGDKMAKQYQSQLRAMGL